MTTALVTPPTDAAPTTGRRGIRYAWMGGVTGVLRVPLLLKLLGANALLMLLASALTFSLYYPVVRRIGPAKAAYSSVVVPIIAMGFSTWLEDYRWTAIAIAGAVLTLAGMLIAISRGRSVVHSPDAA